MAGSQLPLEWALADGRAWNTVGVREVGLPLWPLAPRCFRRTPLSAAAVDAWADCGSAGFLGKLASVVEGGVEVAERC